MAELSRPGVGVGVIIHDDNGNVIVGERAGSHGAGMSILFIFLPSLSFSSLYSTHFNPSPSFLPPQLHPHPLTTQGTLQLPGGHLEHGESFATTAAREALEETGLEIGDVRFVTATNDAFVGEGKHYVTVFVVARIVGEEKVAKVYFPLLPF